MRTAEFTKHDPGGYVLALLGTVAGVAVAALAQRFLGVDDLSLVFMLVVLVVAARTHTGPAALAAVLCFLAYNFFFIAPRYSLYIDAQHGVATVVLFLAAALIAGRMAARLAMQVDALRTTGRHIAARQELSRRLGMANDEDDILQAARHAFDASLEADTWVRIEPPDEARVRIGGTGEDHGWWFLPLRSPDQVLGTIGIKLRDPVADLDDAQRALAHAMADDVAQALLRVRLASALETQRMEVERERLRNALLSSVSHDLRTPLSAMIGAADALALYGDAMGETDRRSLVDTVREEGLRLERFIRNLLDMTRVGQGIAPKRDWIGVDELIGAAIGRLQRTHPDVRIDVDVAGDIGPVWVQPALIEQALFNVLDNAASFSPPGAPVRVDARRCDANAGAPLLRIDVIDSGPGIPREERERVFDLFYSVARGDREREGTGLGLAISRGMVAAHGGTLVARDSADGRGTTMRIVLPLVRPESDASA
jgi:two-component system sensor histidine kinase KdpD